jgi:hypothetical protein
VTNIYQNIPTDEKIKLYLRFCDYLTKEQMQDEKDERTTKAQHGKGKNGEELK